MKTKPLTISNRVTLWNMDDLSFYYDFATHAEAQHFIELVVKYAIEHNLLVPLTRIEYDVVKKVTFHVEPNQENLRNPIVINDILQLARR